MKSTYCTAISKSDDISPEKDISATIYFFITIRRDNPEKNTLSFGYSPNKGGGLPKLISYLIFVTDTTDIPV